MPAFSTVALALRTQKARADGTAPVWLRATHLGRSRFTLTGVAVEPRHWDPKRREVRASHPLAVPLNARFTDQKPGWRSRVMGGWPRTRGG